MKKIIFTKMVASGNDFVVIDAAGLPNNQTTSIKKFVRLISDRKYGAGADGVLLLKKLDSRTYKMRIFNADGSEAEMCGNGARCAGLWIYNQTGKSELDLKTIAGSIKVKVSKTSVKIRLTDPKAALMDIPLKVNNRIVKVNFINTGVPHAVIFVCGLNQLDVFTLGRNIRNHKYFLPRGTNVDFIEVLGNNSIRVRTYERGVEDETLACGTGSTAAALIFALKSGCMKKIKVLTQSREILSVYFKKHKNDFSDIWLEGSAKTTYKGEYNV